MNRTSIAALASLAVVAAAAPALSAPTADGRFAGNWDESSGPQQPNKFRTEMVGTRLKLTLPSSVSPPSGETVWLNRAAPDRFATPAGDKVQASFQTTGANSARLKMKELSTRHFHIFDTNLKRH